MAIGAMVGRSVSSGPHVEAGPGAYDGDAILTGWVGLGGGQ